MKSDDHPHGVHDPVDINKLSESIARATCAALVKLLDLLATAGLTKLAVRTTIHPDNVSIQIFFSLDKVNSKTVVFKYKY